MISFCTTCKGRLAHLRQTLPENLRASRGFAVEFVIVDYDCQDGAKAWIEPATHDGRVRVYKSAPHQYYDSAHAKNIAHRMARGIILFNLDADNMVTPECIQFVQECFAKEPLSVLWGSETHGRYGQVALPKDKFDYMRGYDESLPPGWGAEDVDLVERAALLGLKIKRIPAALTRIIEHPDDMRMENFPVKDWRESNRLKQAARKWSVVANQGKEWGKL